MEKAKKAAGRRSEGLKRRTKRRGRAGTAEREGADRGRSRGTEGADENRGYREEIAEGRNRRIQKNDSAADAAARGNAC